MRWVDSFSSGTAGGAGFPEGVTEGAGAMLWEVPAESEGAVIRRLLAPSETGTEPFSHVGVDVINRGEASPDVTVRVAQGERQLGKETFHLAQDANRRLLLPVSGHGPEEALQIEVSLPQMAQPLRMVLDNVRGFPQAKD
jgi:hypothetical protein